jgi:radical SAM protein
MTPVTGRCDGGHRLFGRFQSILRLDFGRCQVHEIKGIDFNLQPFIVIWEPTRACDLACLHCRAAAQPRRSQYELSTYEGYKLIDQIVELGPKVFVITGGDPLKRGDVYQFIDYARRRGLTPALTPSATPLLTDESISKLKDYGLARLAISLDASTAEKHDTFRGVPGSFDLTVNSIRYARSIGLPVQINTTITRYNMDDFENMFALLQSLDITMWSIFFLVPTGRGKSNDMITPAEVEALFGRMYEASRIASFDIKTTEAMHYRRYVIQQKMKEIPGAYEQFMKGELPDFSAMFSAASNRKGPIGMSMGGARSPRGVNDAKGFVFISHTGEVHPSGFLPISGGNVRYKSLSEIYRSSPIFTALRDRSLLKGKCGRCEFNDICGGSRARAYATTGDPFSEEPLCLYEPGTGPVEQRAAAPLQSLVR